jgi:hypothetical protein
MLSLREIRTLTGLADVLYTFLPGSGNTAWKGHTTFRTIAAKVGVADFWSGGSKKPAIVALLERTLEHERSRFQNLIVEIVRSGLIYRQKQGSPITAGEIDSVNGYILELGFKFPELWNREFRSSLQQSMAERAETLVKQAMLERDVKSEEVKTRSRELSELKDELTRLHVSADRAAAGLGLEKILNRLFALFDLAPRQPFRVTGEQIDGSFELDHQIYLLEAKWEKAALPEADLLIFRGKIEGKSAFTRGLFVALNDISREAKEAIVRGKQPTFFVMNGYDLMMILSEALSLADFLRQRIRRLAEEGAVCLPFTDLRAS